jgi:catechol 2,3-dioxygenase-like lactoylglutathione lyase family enzyme
MAVTFHSLRPMLRTKDLHGTVKFWTGHLGFTCDGLSEEDGWASLSRDDVRVMIATPNAHVPFDTPAFTGSFYFNVDDVTALWAGLKDRVEVAYPMEDFGYNMREFAIYDNNGYMLQFGTPIRP